LNWLWLRVYIVISAVIIPGVICLVSNGLIFLHVRSSSRRIQTRPAAPNESQRVNLSRRDIYLLRHMIIMFCVSVGGQAPSSIARIVQRYTPVS
jgi:hypothetical protein